MHREFGAEPDGRDASQPAGDERTNEAAFEDAFQVISRRIDLLVALLLDDIGQVEAEARIKAIGEKRLLPWLGDGPKAPP